MDTRGAPTLASELYAQLGRRYRHTLDRTVTYTLYRWLALGLLLALYGMRVWYAQGWYIVTYSLGIYLLNLFIGFISPQVRVHLGAARRFRPSFCPPPKINKHPPPPTPTPPPPQMDPETDGPVLPTKASEEYKPFTRKVPEFKFWEAASRGTLLSLCCTVTKATDVPVFWPILVVYFCTLLVFTLRDRVAHMVKHRCVWLHGAACDAHAAFSHFS